MLKFQNNKLNETVQHYKILQERTSNQKESLSQENDRLKLKLLHCESSLKLIYEALANLESFAEKFMHEKSLANDNFDHHQSQFKNEQLTNHDDRDAEMHSVENVPSVADANMSIAAHDHAQTTKLQQYSTPAAIQLQYTQHMDKKSNEVNGVQGFNYDSHIIPNSDSDFNPSGLVNRVKCLTFKLILSSYTASHCNNNIDDSDNNFALLRGQIDNMMVLQNGNLFLVYPLN